MTPAEISDACVYPRRYAKDQMLDEIERLRSIPMAHSFMGWPDHTRHVACRCGWRSSPDAVNLFDAHAAHVVEVLDGAP